MTSPPTPAEARMTQALQLRQRYDAGAAIDDLTSEFRLSHGTVINRLHLAGTRMRTPAQTRHLHTGALQEQARRTLAERLKALYEQGISAGALAEREGLSARTVRRRLVEAGAQLRSPRQARDLAAKAASGRARQRLAADLRERYEAGARVPALATDCGVSTGTVYRLLHQAGARLRPPCRHGSGDEPARPP